MGEIAIPKKNRCVSLSVKFYVLFNTRKTSLCFKSEARDAEIHAPDRSHVSGKHILTRFAHLRGGVVRLSGVTDETHDGRDVHDTALTLLEHHLARRLRAVKHPAQVEVNHLSKMSIMTAESADERTQPGERGGGGQRGKDRR